MNLIMAGIDYKAASLELRERFSFNEHTLRQILPYLKKRYMLSGVVIIATCNRTEIYVSTEQANLDPIELLFCAARFTQTDRSCFHIKKGRAAAKYLFEVAAGIHSMILGDEQIITQVKKALEIACELHMSDAVLNTLFRHAVTCAKTAKTNVKFQTVSGSVAGQCAYIVKDLLRLKPAAKALVVGNGQIGQLTATELTKIGCEVFVTIRKYKHHDIVMPQGCKAVDYSLLTEYLPKVDIVVSATISPNYTITYEMLQELSSYPDYIIDLAVPRDIEPRIKNLPGLKFYDMDNIGQNARNDNTQQLRQAAGIIELQLKKFYEWLEYRTQRIKVEPFSFNIIGSGVH